MRDVIYFSLNKVKKTDKKQLKLYEVCDVWRQGESVRPDIDIAFEKKYKVVDAMFVAQKLQSRYPGAEVENMGGSELVLERPARVTAGNVLLTALLCVVLFFGGMSGIMSFNEDVSMSDMYVSLHEQLTGEVGERRTPYITIPAAIGTPIGFIAVLQIFRRKKLPPGIMDVSMDEYDTSINDYIAKRE